MNIQHFLRQTGENIATFKRRLISLSRFLLIFLVLPLVFPLLALSEEIDEVERFGGDFLQELTAAENLGMGGSFAGSVAGANSINNNPAGLALQNESMVSFNLTRFSRTANVISKLNNADKYEDYGEYNFEAWGIESLNFVFPAGKFGTIGLNAVFRHEGRFSRVDEEGKAVNTFPDNDFAFAFGYGRRLAAGTHIGFDAKFIRSKVQSEVDVQIDQSDEETEEVSKSVGNTGRGYAYNLGFVQYLNQHWRIGGVLRNLSNGLSFSSPEIPDKLRRDVIVGITYQRGDVSDTSFKFGCDVNPPFKDGIRGNMGGEIWYRQLIGLRLGYVKHTQKRFDPVLKLESDKVVEEERLFLTEGFTFGVGLKYNKLEINFAHTPQRKPQAKDDEMLRSEEGNSIVSFSVLQRF